MQDTAKILDNSYNYHPTFATEISVKGTKTDAKEIFDKLIANLQETPEEIKQVIVVRRDLKMSRGELAAQVAHASMKVLLDRMIQHAGVSWKCSFTPAMVRWINGTFTKVVLGCNSVDNLIDLQYKAVEASIPNALVIEKGLVTTCLALGPDFTSNINKLTKKYKLL